MWFGKNKLTSTVKHNRMSIVQKKHDIGPVMPHLTLPIIAHPWLIIKILPFSSCKFTFASSKVKADKRPVGCASIWPLLPMMTCGEPISLPTAFPVTSLINTVSVKMTGWDILLGVTSIIISILVDYVGSKGGGKPGGKGLKPHTFSKHKSRLENAIDFPFLRQARDEVIKTVISGIKKSFIKGAFNSITGLAISALQGNPAMNMSVGVPLVGEVSVSAKSDTGVPELKLRSEVWSTFWEASLKGDKVTAESSAKLNRLRLLGDLHKETVLGKSDR